MHWQRSFVCTLYAIILDACKVDAGAPQESNGSESMEDVVEDVEQQGSAIGACVADA